MGQLRMGEEKWGWGADCLGSRGRGRGPEGIDGWGWSCKEIMQGNGRKWQSLSKCLTCQRAIDSESEVYVSSGLQVYAKNARGWLKGMHPFMTNDTGCCRRWGLAEPRHMVGAMVDAGVG